MIVASGIELRAGARLLLADASFQVAEGDRIGLVGRNGAGKTTLAKVLSGNGQPAAGTIRRTGTVGYLPQDPRTGDLDVLALDRVAVRPRPRRAARGDAQGRGADVGPGPAGRREGDPALRQPVRPARGARRIRGRGAGGVARRQPGAAGPGAAAAAADAVRRAAAADRARADPVRRLADAAARRADQPPGRGLRRVAARPPQELPRRPYRHQPRCRPGRTGREQGLLPGREPLHAGHLQRRLEGVPHAAGGRRAAAPPRAVQRRAAGHRAAGAGGQDARQGHQGQGRAEHAAPGRAAAVRGGGRAGRPTRSPGSASRSPRRAGAPR